jgi:hypothetical protein
MNNNGGNFFLHSDGQLFAEGKIKWTNRRKELWVTLILSIPLFCLISVFFWYLDVSNIIRFLSLFLWGLISCVFIVYTAYKIIKEQNLIKFGSIKVGNITTIKMINHGDAGETVELSYDLFLDEKVYQKTEKASYALDVIPNLSQKVLVLYLDVNNFRAL